MFGLMRAKKCGMTNAEKEFRRLHYCGTCKTLGALYGQKTRFLLNHDTVFLAEILSALKGEKTENWQKALQSFNCLNLPADEMPFALKYAATTNVVLTAFKLADHIADEKKRRYRLAQNFLTREFVAAEDILRQWNFPLFEIKEILETQTARELSARTLDEFAFPTAQTTAVFFREGVKGIGRNELERKMFALGFSFGKIVYLLDAFEDYEKDFRGGKFNAFRAAFDLRAAKLAPENKRKFTAILQNLESEIVAKIYELPLAENLKSILAARLSQNLRKKLKTNLPVLPPAKICAPRPKISFSRRWQNASEKARNLARNYGWQMPLVFLFIFAFTLAAPAATREAKSARECFDLSFNLMFLGSIFSAIAAFPKTVLIQSPGEIAEKAEKKRRWCDYCDCDCDCCDCCCDCGCEGCCDNCGCDGCCDCSCD